MKRVKGMYDDVNCCVKTGNGKVIGSVDKYNVVTF